MKLLPVVDFYDTSLKAVYFHQCLWLYIFDEVNIKYNCQCLVILVIEIMIRIKKYYAPSFIYIYIYIIYATSF
jgi:hypothetical protein